MGRDYSNPPPGCAYWWQTCDDAAPAITALVHGHVQRFFDVQPWAGPVSVLMRAPVVAAVDGAGGSVRSQYDWGALVCLLATVALAVMLVRIAAERGLPIWFQVLVAVGCVVNPVVFPILFWGHPEEALAAALVVGSALFALRGRWVPAGVLLGLAIATKAWALLAVPAVIALAGRERARAFLAAALLSAGLLMAPMALGSPHRFREIAREVGRVGSRPGTLTSANVFWRFSHQTRFTYLGRLPDGRRVVVADQRATVSEGLARAARFAILAIAIGSAAWWARAGGPRRPETVLLLIAFALMARSILDPGNRSYYHAGPLLALIAYETLARRAFPFMSAAFAILFEATSRLASHLNGEAALNVVYLGWAVPFSMWLALELFTTPGTKGSAAEA